MYTATYDDEWPYRFTALDTEIKERVARKISKILEYPAKRHLRKSSYFVDQVGQYRIVYRVFEENKSVRFYFVGTHKETKVGTSKASDMHHLFQVTIQKGFIILNVPQISVSICT